MDYMSTLRPIWRGHWSTTNPRILDGDAGMRRLHDFLKTVRANRDALADVFNFGDKPDAASASAVQKAGSLSHSSIYLYIYIMKDGKYVDMALSLN